MSKLWFAFFKRAAVCAGVSAVLANAVLAEEAVPGPILPESLSERTVELSDRGGQILRVGDTVSYGLAGGDAAAEARWSIDSRIGGLKSGFLFRSGRLFTPLAAGRLSLPALPVVDEKGEIVARTRPTEITIESNFTEKERAAGEPPKPEPALGPIGLPFPVWIQSAVAFALLATFLVGAFFIVRYVRRKASAALKKLLPKKPYDVTALDRLDGLLKAKHLEKGAFKPFYFGLSETLKFYLGERFDFDARESTTFELIAKLKELSGAPGLGEPVVRKIQALYEAMDSVKFADRIPAIEEAQETHRQVRDLITSTRKTAAAPILDGSPAAARGGSR